MHSPGTERMSTHRDINEVLPRELLCKIFKLSLDPQYLKRDRCRLSLVCRLWYQWVEDSALLWTNITAPVGLSYLNKSFKNSKEALLELKHWAQSRSAPFVSVERFMQEASAHAARWRSLSVAPDSPPNWEEVLRPLTTQSAPKLEVLKINGRGMSDWNTGRISITIGDGTFPNLDDVFLACVPASVHASSSTALRSFDIDQIHHISLHELVGILENSPHLETLRVRLCWRVKMTGKTWSVDSIKLERLVHIKLLDLDASVIDTILSIIRAPNCDKLIISCAIPDPPSHMVLFNSSTGHLFQRFREKDQKRPLLDVRVGADEEGDEYLSVDVGYIHINVRVNTNGVAQLQNILRWIGGNSDPEGSYPVSLECDFLDAGYVEAFGPPFHVKRIKIYDYTQHSALEHLSRSRLLGSSAWPCPQLEHLEYDIVSDLDSRNRTYLLDMLKARYGRENIADGSGKPLPTPLKSITLRSEIRPDELIRDIKEILRDLEINWKSPEW
ncbi:hypothetical protein M407DRAFT_17132 [Tulasnella calospora MUT 4182]|uniref:F-box domain-containing protein n=1 Tax=Tulasnella calospora MUT 4182 TaxID=1051891 RepID=A0A0C3QML7_9AGAM|nr:hypothetical protein M407DRAFT_17132 [Tulasnella calospora MUT 4182]